MNAERLSQLMDGEWHELNPSECIQGVCGDDTLRSKWSRYHLIRDVMNNESVKTDSLLVSRICAAIADEPGYSNVASLVPQPSALSQPSANLAAIDPAQQPVHISESAAGTSAEASAKTDSATAAAVAAPRQSLFGTGLAGFALAASVAAVTVLGMNLWQGQSVEQGQTIASNVATAVPAVDGGGAFSQQVQGVPLPEVDFVANTGAYWISTQSAERVSDEQRLNMFLSQHIENSPTADREGLLPYSRLVGYDERGAGR